MFGLCLRKEVQLKSSLEYAPLMYKLLDHPILASVDIQKLDLS